MVQKFIYPAIIYPSNFLAMNKKLIIALVVIIAIIIIAGFHYQHEKKYRYYLQTPVAADDNNRVLVNIQEGMSAAKIAEELKSKDLLLSTWAFERYLRENKADTKLAAGRFILARNQTIPQIVKSLVEGKITEKVVTFTEGMTIRQMDNLLASEGLISTGEFTVCSRDCQFDFSFLADRPQATDLEGYLFPDTYFFDPAGTSGQEAIQRMLSAFDQKVNKDLGEAVKKSGHSLYEIIVMASMIEKEAQTEKDMKMVSDILWRRSDSGISLGVDATVRYALNKWKEPLTVADLDTESPYNTRKYRGLPPGPICNPGLAAIKAAISPEKNDYWYYLTATESGEMIYSKTNDEHNQNRVKYIR